MMMIIIIITRPKCVQVRNEEKGIETGHIDKIQTPWG
jgi:hypothetical protein